MVVICDTLNGTLSSRVFLFDRIAGKEESRAEESHSHSLRVGPLTLAPVHKLGSTTNG